jgi:hypothetical protein
MKKHEKILITFAILLILTIFSQSAINLDRANSDRLMSSNLNGSTMPSNLSGIIVLWNGNLSSIPDGWAICDGKNGSPNLIDRFVMSVGEFENPGATGGSIKFEIKLRNFH